MTSPRDVFGTWLPFDMTRPSWAVMAPARGGGSFPAGAHEVFWTQRGETFRCTRCQEYGTLPEFEASQECGR